MLEGELAILVELAFGVGCPRLPSKFHKIEVELLVVARKTPMPGVQY
jgi:hypothetical protein